MTPKNRETLTQALITAWAAADRAAAILRSERVAAYKAGDTELQHKLGVVHTQIEAAAVTLADAVRALNNRPEGESK